MLKIQKAINEALAKNPADKHLNSQLIKLGSAKICTIDSFYLDLLRSNFAELELPPAFRIADTAEGALLSDRIMNLLIESIYSGEDSDISPTQLENLADCLTDSKKQNELADVIGRIYEKTMRNIWCNCGICWCKKYFVWCR